MGLSTISYICQPLRNSFLIILFLNMYTKFYQRPKFFDLCFTSPLMKAGIGQSMWSTVCSGVERECEGEKKKWTLDQKSCSLRILLCACHWHPQYSMVYHTTLLLHQCEVPEQPQHTKEKMCLGLVQTLINYSKLGIYVVRS